MYDYCLGCEFMFMSHCGYCDYKNDNESIDQNCDIDDIDDSEDYFADIEIGGC